MHSLGPSFMDPNYLLGQFGGAFFWFSILIVFIECGVLFPFLPGDSLLFSIGLFTATSSTSGFHIPLWQTMPLLMIAAFAGNVAGYEIGRVAGARLYERDGRVVKRSHFDKTSAFFDHHGNKALVIGRFVPVVRTFITLVAGASRMDRRRFFTWSAVGAVLWVAIVTLAGLALGKTFPGLGKNIDVVILAVVLVSLLPALFEWWRHRKATKELIDESADAVEKVAHRD
ncbi:DedA family protein [Allobranchiibius huperziae]|nr:VTT domain-containing protein [Allobranchiibius huperziae]